MVTLALAFAVYVNGIVPFIQVSLYEVYFKSVGGTTSVKNLGEIKYISINKIC